MATGIPKKKTSSVNGKVHLSYKGKLPIENILDGETIDYSCIYSQSPSNRFYFGDNIYVLRSLMSDSSLCGKINLVYIDPPFSTQNHFVSRKQSKAYEDNMTGADFVEFLRQRLVLLHKLLSDCGSIYVHLDENMIFEIKLVMDEIFGSTNFRNLIVRKKCNPKNYTHKAYGNIADFILFYTKTDKYIWNKPTVPLSENGLKEYQYIEEKTGRKYMKVPIHAPGIRNGETGMPWRGMLPPPGKHWQYTPKTLDAMDARGEIFWSLNGNPRRKVYLDEHPGVNVQDIWLEYCDAHNQNIEITGYPTEKNPNLLRRIISASSNPGDYVLDCFAGSGTTLAIADEMQRNWIGVDNSMESIKTILKRFNCGLQPMGDYVNKKILNKDDTQTLFDSLEKNMFLGDDRSDSCHKSIKKFSLYVPSNISSENISIIKDCLKKTTPILPIQILSLDTAKINHDKKHKRCQIPKKKIV